MYKIISPLKITLSHKKDGSIGKEFILNLNNYRNAYFRTLNQSKIMYKKAIVEQLQDKPRYNRVAIIYQVFKGDNRRYDIGNVLSIHQKYFEDALVETGKLPDDKAELLPMVIYLRGGVDKDNPRVEITVCDINNTKDLERLEQKLEYLRAYLEVE